jgi:hypothetical protein
MKKLVSVLEALEAKVKAELVKEAPLLAKVYRVIRGFVQDVKNYA